MVPNFIAVFAAALIPMVVGFIWYHDKVFGKRWQVLAEMTPEKMQGANMGRIFGISYLLSVLAAITLNVFVVHQFAVYSIMAGEAGFGDPNSEVGLYLSDFMARYGNHFRTFGHGAFHGTVAGLFLAMPVLGINALFERKGFQYIAINGGYWAVTFGLMGGILCAWT